MRRRGSLTTGLVLLALMVVTPAMAGHSWGGYHWDGSGTPLGLELEDNLDNSWDPILVPVLADWDGDDSYGTLNLSEAPADGSSVCANPLGAGPTDIGQIEVCNDSYGGTGWLGVARIWLAPDGSHITAAVAAVNDSYLGPGGAYDDPNARRHVLCQEIGHTFGLDHQRGPRNQTCMNDQWGLLSSSFLSPNAHDYDQLASIYSHLGGSSGGDDGGSGGPCKSNPNHWKCNSGSGGPHSVQRLADGRIVVTWITWAPGHARG